MINWEIKLFKDIVQFPPKVTLDKGKSYSFIPMEVLDGVTKYVSPKHEKVWSGSGGAKFENGDTLFARITPCLQNGKISQAKNLKDGKGFGSTEYFIFRGIEDKSDSDFIYYLSQTEDFRKYAIGSMVGASGRQRADATFVGQYEVNLPPLPTQKRIASILSAYDDIIENNLKRIKLLEELAQRTYEEWFVKFRINGKQLEVGENGLPDGWERKKLNELVNFSQGIQIPIENQYTEFNNGFIRFIRIVDITQSSQEIRFIKKPLDKFIIDSNDLFMVRYGTPQVVIGYKGAIANNFFRILIKDEKILFRKYLYSTLNQKSIKEYLLGISTSATMPAISFTSFGSMNIVLPRAEIQEEFEKLLSKTHNKILNLQSQNNLLKESRDILLPRLMSGKIGVGEAVKAQNESLKMVAEPREEYSKG